MCRFVTCRDILTVWAKARIGNMLFKNKHIFIFQMGREGLLIIVLFINTVLFMFSDCRFEVGGGGLSKYEGSFGRLTLRPGSRCSVDI
jgi:hypothetical protein